MSWTIRLLVLLAGCHGCWRVMATDGLWFISEPPAWLEFTNMTGASVSCTAGGHPTPQMSWMMAGGGENLAAGPLLTTEIPGLRRVLIGSSNGPANNNATLVFPPFPATAYRPDVHSVSYRCRASSPAGTIVSREMRLRAVLVQSYEAQAIGGSSVKGGVAVLRCAVPPSVRNDVLVSAWVQEFTGHVISPTLQGDGKHHMLPSSGDLYVYGVEKSDGRAAYRCRTQLRFPSGTAGSTGSVHQLSSNTASITVTEAASVTGPSVTTKTSSIQVEADGSVTIPCLAQGYPVPEIKWYRLESNGRTAPMDELVASFGVLVLEHVQPEDGGTYRCVAVNSAGQAQHDVRLEVVEPLRVQIEPVGPVLSVHQSQSVTLQCVSNHLNAGLAQQQQQQHSFLGASLKWFKDGVAISSSNHPNKYQSGGSGQHAHSGWLRIDNMQRTDQGMYQCIFQTDRESAQASIRLVLGEAAPHLVQTFNEQTLVPGPSVTLRCSATGNPPPEIIWLLDRQPFVASTNRITQSQQSSSHHQIASSAGAAVETTGYLNITGAQVEDGGEYTCVARNAAGEAAHSARLNVYGLPYIRPIPKITAVAEADMSIKCPAAGYPIMEIVWSKGDEVLRDGSKYGVDHQAGVLTIRSVAQSTDRGVYSCIVRDRQGRSARRDFTIDVVVAPKITPFAGQQTDPAGQHGLRLGERLTLTCAIVKGDLPLVIDWTVDGRPMLPGQASVKTVQIDPYTSLLSVDSLLSTHAGNYTCNVHNPALVPVARHRVSQSQLVVIQVPPKIEPFSVPEEQLLRQGTRTRLLCGVSQGDKPLDFSWTKDDRQLSVSAPLPAVTIRDLDADSSVLTFTNLTAVHSGRYQCIVRNTAGVTRSSARLYVQVPPFWVVEPRDVAVLQGQPLNVHCQADGYPKPNVTWTRGADTTGILTNRTAPLGLRVLDNGTLVMRAARKSLQGRYTCRAVNRLGQELIATISITVNAGPRFRDSVSRLAVKRDVQVTLHCIVEGDGPGLHLAWRRSSSATSFLSSNYRMRIQEKEVPDGLMSTLTIPNAQTEDTGVYICVASNIHGQVERDFQLNILEPPEQPRHLQVLETFSRRVSLSWLPPAGSVSTFNPLIAYIVQYREANHGNWHETDSLPAYSTTYTVEGLQPSTSYQIRVLAETNADRGPPSETIAAATYGEPPGSSPTDLRAVAVSSTSLRLTWTSIIRTNWHSPLIGYQLGFRPEDAMSYNFTTIPLTDGSTINKAMEITLYHLRKAVKYLIVARAFNRYGEGPLSPAASATTMEDAPSASPQSVRCSTTSWQSIDVTWQSPPAAEQNGLIQQYRVHYERMAATSASGDVAAASGPQLRAVDGLHLSLTNLAAYSTYRIRVEAVTRKGVGPLSPPVACLTDESVPSAPADLKAYSSSPAAFTLCWSPPSHPNGEILHYTLSIKAGNSGGSGPSGIQRHIVPATQTYFEVTNLAVPQPSFYEVWLTATNRAGIGDKSKVLRHSPGFKANSAASICSFGRRLIVPWKTTIDLPCIVLGSAGQHINWTHNGRPMEELTAKTRNAHIQPAATNGTSGLHRTSHLTLTDLKRSDAGNYSCSVRSGELITYHLAVLVPPPPPVLMVVGTGTEQIQIQWNSHKEKEEQQSTSSSGFLLHWRHADGGDWEERELDRLSSSAQLDNLRCGTRYHIYLTGYNAVGTSPPSNTVTARTKGEAPLVPSSGHAVVTANTSHAVVHLNSWQERGCPILSFGVEYKMDGDTYWNTVSDDIQNLPTIFIEDVQPSTAYQLRIRARTSAGIVPAEYEFVTLDSSGQTPTGDRINRAGRPVVLLPTSNSVSSVDPSSGSHVVLPWWLIGAVSAVGTSSLLGLMVACVCLYKTRNESRRLLVASNLPSDSTLIDGNATWNRSHKSASSTAVLDRNTASSKRSSTFELHSMGDKMSINYSPDDQDDIYPYATFELHRERPRSPVKMHDNPPDFTRLKYARECSNKLLPSRPPPTWSELSTIEVERHFQGSPSVSDSDLENLAVPPEFGGQPQQQRYHHQRPISSASGFSIHGIIHHPKEYASKSSLKRFVKDDYAGSSLNESQQHTLPKQPHRPSHPTPAKKLGTLRLIDQSNLWSGPCITANSSHCNVTASGSAAPSQPPWSGGIVRPKASRNNGAIKHAAATTAESPLDHSIAV